MDLGYNRGYTLDMKTAVSIPEDVYRSAEEARHRLGISRSELYAKAVAAYVERCRDEATTEALDRVYEHEDSRLDPLLVRLQTLSLRDDQW